MPSVDYRDQRDITDVCLRGDTASLDIWYPQLNNNPKYLEVGLMDVRASDGIRISYDFERDGWKIEQGSKWSWSVGETPDEDWQEVAFVQSWGRDPQKGVSE